MREKTSQRSQEQEPQVAIVMGSDSDLEVMLNAGEILERFSIPYVLEIASAHRTPELVRERVKSWEQQGVRVIIAGAGCAAHLPGVIASETLLPVIGVPLVSGPLQGMDAVFREFCVGK